MPINLCNKMCDESTKLRQALNCSHIHVMLLATSAYVICICGIILMFIWYAPQPSCLLNIFFITWTLVLLQLMTSVSLHPKVSSNSHNLFCPFAPTCPKFSSLFRNCVQQVNAGYLTPGLMGLYVVFLCWSAVRRHVTHYSCFFCSFIVDSNLCFVSSTYLNFRCMLTV